MLNTKPITKCERDLSFQCTGVADFHVERKSTTLEIDTNMCCVCLPQYVKYVATSELHQLTITSLEFKCIPSS